MQIVPIRDLKNTVEIERLCDESDGPVFITKNGYGRLVVMNIEYYEKTMQKITEAEKINKGITDYKSGKVADGKTAIRKLREKHGLA